MARDRRDRDDEFDDDRPARRRPRDDDRDDYADGPGGSARRGPPQKGANVCGIIALILGVVGLVFSLIPCIGIIGLPMAAIGLVLGIIGIFTSGQTTGRGLPIAGTCVSVAALLIGGGWLLFFAYMGKKGQERMEVLQKEVEQQAQVAQEQARVAEEERKRAEKELRDGPALTVTAEKLNSDYESNALSADAKYKGKVLEVTGQMLKFDKDRFGRLTVDLDAGEGMVRCDFPRGTENQLEKLKPTQKVTIRGRCTGRDRKDLIKLEDCILVSRK